MDKRYLSKYYSFEQNHWWFIVREKIIVDAIRKWVRGHHLTILNTGPASGKSSLMLQQFGNVMSLENDPDACSFLRDELGIPITQGSVTAIPYSNETFNLVCAFDVIEHIEDDHRAVVEMKRVLAKGGHLVVTVPAFSFLWSAHDVINHHKRRYTAADFRKILQKNGFRIVHQTYFNTFLFLPIAAFRFIRNVFQKEKVQNSDFETILSGNSFANYFFKSVFSLERIVLKKLVMPFGVSIMFVARKEEHSDKSR